MLKTNLQIGLFEVGIKNGSGTEIYATIPKIQHFCNKTLTQGTSKIKNTLTNLS